MYPAWEHFDESTQGFHALYLEITKDLKEYAKDLDPAVCSWFESLIQSFEEAFQAWKHDRRLRGCLREIHEQSAAFRVLAYAYIHIAYDLPRCIRGRLPGSDGVDVRNELDAYFRAREVMFRTLARECVKLRILGLYAFGFRALCMVPFVDRAIFGGWISKVRNRALYVAYELDQRHYNEELLWEIVQDNIHYAMLTKNPFGWLDRLDATGIPDPHHRPSIIDVVEPLDD